MTIDSRILLVALFALTLSSPGFAQSINNPNCPDNDGDGYTTCQNDCDDSNASIHPGAPDNTCNGINEDCDSFTDESYTVQTSSCGVGACFKYGNLLCTPGGVIVDTCTPQDPAPNDTTCDGKDDDCDGIADEDYVSVSAECGVGACGTTGPTVCIDGVVVSQCVPNSPTALDDDCDGVDDDCDGQKDEHYVAPETSCGIGICARTGLAKCIMGNIVDTCNPPNPGAADTICNGKDDDCDGLVDEDFQPAPFSCGSGLCENTVLSACVDGQIQIDCSPLPPLGSDNNCDGVDDDCDGQSDEHYVPTDTSCGVGACARTGKAFCNAGNIIDSCNPLEPAEADTDCNGKDDDCDGLVDEDYISISTTCGTGACASTGTSACVDGLVQFDCTPGTPASSDATCDGIDDDCDGTIDENYAVSVTQCGEGACFDTGNLYCSQGQVLDSCTVGIPGVLDNTCDGMDDDCDGQIDEDFVPGASECGVGQCVTSGTTQCVAGIEIDVCTPVSPQGSDDNCDGMDDDCDGQVDEHFVSGVTTTCGVGGCASDGTFVCQAGTLVDTCSAGNPADADLSCNGKDDDCDGQVDEDYVPEPMTCGSGSCQANGFVVCMEGFLYAECTPGDPSAIDDTCDGVDDDCDGSFDEDFQPGQTTECGSGGCASIGALLCIGGDVVDSCVPALPAADDASCNGVDNDCDGLIDEDFQGEEVACGLGACAATGVTVCVDGEVVESCEEAIPAQQDATCNGIDEDCDGSVDEDFVSTETQCGVGACAATGALVCDNGAVVDTCETLPAEANDATCDGIDNNCNGVVDEEYASEEVACGQGPCESTGTTSCQEGAVVSSCVAGLNADLDGSCRNAVCAQDPFCCDFGWDQACALMATEQCAACVDPNVGCCNAHEATGCGDVACEEAVCAVDAFCCEGSWDASCVAIAETVCADCFVPQTDASCCEAGPQAGCGDAQCQSDVCAVDGYCCSMGWDSVCVSLAQEACEVCADEGSNCCVSHDGVGCDEATCQDVICTDDSYCCEVLWDATCALAADQACEVCEEPFECCEDCADDKCDGIDDDCDGEVDEDFPVEITSCGVGGCASEGQVACVDGEVVNTCMPSLPLAQDECNGVDDDCDGEVDEDFVGEPSTCGVGVCPAEGEVVCAGGQVVDTCVAPVVSEDDSNCNGIDDDCDGEIDEDYVSIEGSCGVGACAAKGPTACVEGVEVVTNCTPGTPADFDESCDGIDDDCDGSIDEDFISDRTQCDVGSCAAIGETQCQDGEVVDTCEAPVPAEADVDCNGVDDDCDGEIDEDYVSVPGSCGVGACVAQGPTACVDGQAVVTNCTPGIPAASDESCDGIDNDCDGSVDEDFVSESTSCDVGACDAQGTTVCVAGEVVDTCEAPVPAEADVDCNGVDDDCDGEIDEDYISVSGSCGVGACVSEGPTACVDGAEVVTNCTPGEPAADDAQCDGVDNDCDGDVDEDYVSEPTSCDVGSCAAQGETQCKSGEVVDTCVAPTPADADTDCNGIDDDCDGEIDEDYISVAGSCGVGACASEGPTACVDGEEVVTECTPGAPATDDATCDGIDNDCDGSVDEDFVGEATSCATGTCGATGETICKSGEIVDTCVAPVPAADDSVCDGIDNDCDGEIDEDYQVAITTCGEGLCGSKGRAFCVNGALLDTCVPKDSPYRDDVTCDGIDDDCDGEFDEDYAPEPTHCGIGACLNTGETQCVDGSVEHHCIPGAPLAAVDMTCDNVDDNCNGDVDEDYAAEDVVCGVGACSFEGTGFCEDGVETTSCEDVVVSDTDATCDGVDDDCDGQIDEDYAMTDTVCGEGVCAASGRLLCEGGVKVDTCQEGTPAASDECDELDNDCDGEVDEDCEVEVVEPSCGEFVLSQGDWARDIRAFDGNQDVESFYSYGDPVGASSNTGLETSEQSVMVLHRDPQGVLSFVMMHDAVDDGTGGSMELSLTGLTQGELAAKDDPRHDLDHYDMESGEFAWTWYGCCTDGMAIENVGDDLCVTIDPVAVEGIEAFAFFSGGEDMRYVTLPSTDEPFTICQQTECGEKEPTCKPMSELSQEKEAIEAGPIWNNDHAQVTCPTVCEVEGRDWTGHWWTTIWGSMSVCECALDYDNACAVLPERALWIQTDGVKHSDPTNTGKFGSSEAAALLEARGVEWDAVRLADIELSLDLLGEYKVVVLYGKGLDGPLTDEESALFDKWVKLGGGLLYHTHHPTNRSCGMVDSLPESFGVACVPGNAQVSGEGLPAVVHPLTANVAKIKVLGGEQWEVSEPALAVVTHENGSPIVFASEVGQGRVVGISDEWPLYNEGTRGNFDISAEDNRTLVDNVFCWLTDGECLEGNTYWRDADGDGYGDPTYSIQALEQPEGTVNNDQDCDDSNSAIAPGQQDLCDGVDNDCDGTLDEDFVAEDTSCGLGACAGTGILECVEGVVVDTCEWAAEPQPEACDGVDNDCDGEVDEDAPGIGYRVVQGDWSVEFQSFAGVDNVVDFYSYGTEDASSSNTGFEMADASVWMLYEDENGVLSLVILNDAANDGSGGKLALKIKGLDSGEVVLLDDPNSPYDSADMEEGSFIWKWWSCCNDGVVVEDIDPELSIEVTPRKVRGISDFAVVSGDGEYHWLPERKVPFTIEKVQECKLPLM